MLRFLLAPLLLACVLLGACTDDAPSPDASATPTPTLTRQATGTDVLFVGISPVDTQTVWLSGTEGTVARTADGGTTWTVLTVPGADSLQFRDVHAVDATTAYVLSIGSGAASRIYKTTDGGGTWTLQFQNEVPDAFYDCMGFWNATHGIAFSDAVDGAFPVIVTRDGGATWTRVPAEALPAALPGEGSFAASGTCLTTHGDSTAWFGTGASTTARVFKTTDRGQTWTVAETPLVSDSASGIASLTFRDARHGVALGGDIAAPEAYSDNVALTTDGGQTWTLAGRPEMPGAIYGSAYVPDVTPATLVAVGPGGMDLSTDDGQSWRTVDTLTHWSVAFRGRTGWAVGPEGRVTRIDF
ncbi:MAG: hypothetical protein GVY18_02540 [Bacteroidetes bacterium]|jgi:photosystem II stability/assembly factor-like uncharacterized protein|nr:hypothetical protein [Bacteroidota bacterium]